MILDLDDGERDVLLAIVDAWIALTETHATQRRALLSDRADTLTTARALAVRLRYPTDQEGTDR